MLLVDTHDSKVGILKDEKIKHKLQLPPDANLTCSANLNGCLILGCRTSTTHDGAVLYYPVITEPPISHHFDR